MQEGGQREARQLAQHLSLWKGSLLAEISRVKSKIAIFMKKNNEVYISSMRKLNFVMARSISWALDKISASENKTNVACRQ